MVRNHRLDHIQLLGKVRKHTAVILLMDIGHDTKAKAHMYKIEKV